MRQRSHTACTKQTPQLTCTIIWIGLWECYQGIPSDPCLLVCWLPPLDDGLMQESTYFIFQSTQCCSLYMETDSCWGWWEADNIILMELQCDLVNNILKRPENRILFYLATPVITTRRTLIFLPLTIFKNPSCIVFIFRCPSCGFACSLWRWWKCMTFMTRPDRFVVAYHNKKVTLRKWKQQPFNR